MYSSNTGRRWRLALIACSLALLGAGAVGAAPLMPVRPPDLPAQAEPFARSAVTLPGGDPLSAKWQSVAREIEDELLVVALCEEDHTRCTATP